MSRWKLVNISIWKSWKAGEQLKLAEIIIWRQLKSWWGAETAWNSYLNKRTFTFTFTGEQLKLDEICVRKKKTLSLSQVGYPTSLLSVRALLDNDFANIAVSLKLASQNKANQIHLRFFAGPLEEVDRVRPPCVEDCQEIDLPWQEQNAGKIVVLRRHKDKDKYKKTKTKTKTKTRPDKDKGLPRDWSTMARTRCRQDDFLMWRQRQR